jgi:hypothetical protein
MDKSLAVLYGVFSRDGSPPQSSRGDMRRQTCMPYVGYMHTRSQALQSVKLMQGTLKSSTEAAYLLLELGPREVHVIYRPCRV